MTFRHATAQDLEAVLAVIGRADEQSADWAPGGRPHAPAAEHDRRRLSDWIVAPDHYNEVAEINGRVAGFVNVHPRGGDAFVGYLFVDPEHQGGGIGAELLERALADAARGHDRARLSTAVLNTGARRFYERAGWTDTGRRHDNDELGLEMAEYALDLRAP